MIPFPGESVPLDDAADVTGGLPLFDSLRNRGGIGGQPANLTISAGDEWRFWVYDGEQTYLEDDTTPVDVSWVVEVAGGAGTLTASAGVDPDYGDPGAAHPVDLGTHALSGASTLVLPTTLTAADVMAGGASMMLVLECTTGSVDVQQVKLRVWPPGGALGGWSSTNPGFETAPTAATVRYTAASMTGTASDADAETAWDDAQAAFAADVAAQSVTTPRAYSSVPSSSGFARQTSAQTGPDELTSTTELGAVLVLILGRDWRSVFPIAGSLDEEVDWVIPPAEVVGDVASYVQAVGAGSTGWANAVVTVSTTATVDDLPGEGIASSVGGSFAASGSTATTPLTHAGLSGASALDTSGLNIAVTITHTVATSAAETWPPSWASPGVLGLAREDQFGYVLGVDDQPVKTYAILPPYQVWAPTAPPEDLPLAWSQRVDGMAMAGVTSWAAARGTTPDLQWHAPI